MGSGIGPVSGMGIASGVGATSGIGAVTASAAGAGSPQPAIEVDGLIAVHAAGTGAVAALRGLDLTVAEGEVAAVVGPSGSGKTTFLRTLAGAERPTAGSIVAFGIALERAPGSAIRAYRRDVVAVVDQHYRRALSPYLPAQEIVELPLALRAVAPRARRARADDLLDAVGLASRRRALPTELSGGEQQRLAVAAALAIRPRLLLADEPTGELDTAATGRLLELIRELVRRDGVTAIIVTHDAAVEAIADRVVVLQDGRAVATRVGPAGATEVRAVDGAGWTAPERTWRHADPASAVGRPRPAAVPRALVPEPVAVDRTIGADASEPAVRLVGVSRRYDGGPAGVIALEDVSADIAATGVHVIVGPSGSGKSTLLRLIAGLDRPDGGRVVVLGRDLATLDREALASFRARRVGIAEQARGLVPFLEVRENVALALAVRAPELDGVPGAERIEALLDRLGIAHLAGRRPVELSAGERTRAAIARALVAGPELLLLDEPTATLDRVSAARVADLLADLGHELTVAVATHDPALVDVARSAIDLGRGAAARTDPARTDPARTATAPADRARGDSAPTDAASGS